MHAPYSLWIIAPLILLVNLPFGYWRARCRKFSVPWFTAIHLPMLFVILLRFLFGIPFRLFALPFYTLAFVAGQFVGGLINRPSPHRP